MVTTYAFAIMILITYPLAWGAAAASTGRNRKIYGNANLTANVLVVLIVLAFIIFAGFRNITGFGIDEYAYRNRVMGMIGQSLGDVLSGNKEYLDTIPNWIIGNCLHESQWIFVWNASVTYISFVYCIYRQCDNFELGILFLFLLNIVNVSFNTMQQMEAVAVTMFGIPYLYKRDFKKYLIVILIAFMIHNSAIVMLALYFISNMKPWSLKFMSVAFVFAVVAAVFNRVAPGLFATLGLFQDYGYSFGSGVKGITVLVAFIPLAFALAFKSTLAGDDKEMNCAINMTLVYAMIYIVSTQNLYVARFAMYIQPFLIIFYTKLITRLRKDRLSTLVYYVLVFGYGATTVYFTRGTKYHFVKLF